MCQCEEASGFQWGLYFSKPAAVSCSRQWSSPSADISVWIKIDQAFELTDVAQSLSMNVVDWKKKIPHHTHTQWRAEDVGTEMPQAHWGFYFLLLIFHGLPGTLLLILIASLEQSKSELGQIDPLLLVLFLIAKWSDWLRVFLRSDAVQNLWFLFNYCVCQTTAEVGNGDGVGGDSRSSMPWGQMHCLQRI